LEGGEVLELRCARRLQDRAVLEVRAVEKLVAGIGPLSGERGFDASDRPQLKTGERAIRQVRVAAAREDPAGLVQRQVLEILREEPVDVRETRAGGNVVKRDDRIEILENLL